MIAKRVSKVLQSLLLATSCACSTAPDGEINVTQSDLEQDWETFRGTVYREPFEHGVFIVEGDTPISDEAALRQYYNTHIARTAQRLTVLTSMGADVIWQSSDKFDLTYCISNAFSDRKAAVIEAMDAASRSWSDRVGARFRYVPTEDANCTAVNGNVVFDVNPVFASYFARAFFPDSAREQRNLLITDAAFTTTVGGRDFQGILRHELGHALGFRHEHIWSATCAGESISDARLITEYDVDSVMHYPQCRPVNIGGYRQTEADYRGAISLYGLAPALIVSSLHSLAP
jgi:hypothetical protein